MLSVYDGRECIGFILRRGGGAEAFTADDRSVGLFKDVVRKAHTFEEEAPDTDTNSL